MKRYKELWGDELEWVQPNAFRMEYELRAGQETAARLAFRSSFGSLATAESGDGCWTFKRVGFWQPRLTVRACGQDSNLAVFRMDTWKGGGTLEFPDGRVLRATTNFWQTDLQFVSEAGEPLLHFRRGGFVHLSARVDFEPAAAGEPEMPLLLLFGWYVVVMMYMDSAAATAAVVAVG